MSIETRRYEKRARADREEETRARIAAAAAELHAEVGPRATTVAEIARRARVSRLTVYNHFPDDASLYPACAAHWASTHPIPDFQAAMETADSHARAEAVLLLAYREIYRGWGPMMFNLQRDRGGDAALDEMMRVASDAVLDNLADGISSGAAQRAMARLALDFWTWRRLDADGLADEDAAALMAGAIAGADA